MKMGKRVEGIAREVLNDFLVYDWPGNVRELANLLERAVILCDEALLRREHVGILKSTSQPVVDPTLNLLESERKQIVRALLKTNWVVGGANGAAKLLGVNRTTLIAKMKRLGIRKFESLSEF